MTVLPNSFERYTASLRILTSLLILKHGLKKKYLKNLSKIYTAESFYNCENFEAVDINKLSLSLLCAVSVVNSKQNGKLHFQVNTVSTFYINKNIFIVLLLNLCKNCREIYISESHNQIIINFKGKYKKSLPALKMLKGFYFYLPKNKRGKFVIPAHTTLQESVNLPNVWENVTDRFSPVNMFFENVL